MKIREFKKYCCMLGLAVGILTLTGCGAETKEVVENQVEQEDVETEEMSTEVVTDGEKEEIESEETTEAEEIQDTESVETGFTFAEVENIAFYFSSGAGAWHTELNIHPDGTFDGYYYDSDMGDTGEGYPNGVMYYSAFDGQFSQLQKVDDFTYSFKIENITLQNEPGTEEIMDGTLYRYSEAYGLEKGGEMHMYLPKSQLSNLPEGYLSWIQWELADVNDGELPFYGLYNTASENGFSGYATGADTENQTDSIDAELAEIEAKSVEIETRLSSAMLNQMELNQLSAEWYTLWDDELNSIWSRLKEKLDEETMAAIKEEQISWIEYKESEVAAKGEEFGMGSMRPLEENTLAAEMTRERVYELIELLR